LVNSLINNNILCIEKIRDIDLDLKKELDYNLFNFAWIEVTNKCNFSCIHCYGSFNPQNFYELSIEDINLIVENLINLKISNIQIIGGEPFVLKEKLKQILLFLNEKGFTIEVFTNGYYLNKDWIDFLKTYNIKIAMSIYSHKEKLHNKITNNDKSFINLRNSIKFLENAGISYRLAYVKMKYNDNSSEKDIQKNLCTNSKIKADPIRIVGNASKNLLG